jgi:hypothetical protein
LLGTKGYVVVVVVCSAIVEYDGYLFMYQTILKVKCTPAIQFFPATSSAALGSS